MALLFPFGEKNGRHYYNSCLVTDKNGKQLGIYRKTHIPAILPSKLPGGTGSYEKFYFSPGVRVPGVRRSAARRSASRSATTASTPKARACSR